MKANGFHFALRVFLNEDCACGICQYVNLEGEWFGWVRLLKGGIVQDHVYEGVEGMFAV